MDIAMERATVGTAIAAETTGEHSLAHLARKDNGERRRRSEVPLTALALGDSRSRMEHAAQQQS